MKGLQFMFPGASRLWVIIMFSIFGALSCQEGCRCRGCTGCGGCTTSVVVDHEDKKMKVDGIRIKIRANKNRVTNRKLKILSEDIYVDKDRWYVADYFLRVEKRDAIKNICEYGIPKNHHLTESIKKFSIQFSPDKKHFAVGLDDDVFNFFHLLPQGVPYSSGCYYFQDANYTYVGDANLKFSNIDWSRFPEPDKLFSQIIVPNDYAVWTFVHNQSNVLKLLDEMPPGNQHEMVLIEHWYNDIANAHFTEHRVKQIAKVSDKWKQKAQKRLLDYIGKNPVNIHLKASLNRILWIDDKATLQVADSMVFINYFADDYAGEYFIKRYRNSNAPLSKEIKKELYAEAKTLCLKPDRKSFSFDESMSLTTAVEFLLLEEDDQTLELFIKNNVTLSMLEESFNNVPEATIEKYDKYPPNLQGLMVKKYVTLMKVPDSDIFGLTVSNIVKFLKDKTKCGDLKEIVRIHEKDLMGFRMPKRCQ